MNDTYREETVRLRRQQILTAAVAVFAERGFHGATVRDVAKAAGVADGTIYNYFPNKTALLLGLLDPAGDAGVPPVPLEASLSDVRMVFRQLFARRLSAFDAESHDALRVVLSEALVNPEVRTLYTERVIAPVLVLAEPLFKRLAAAGAIRATDLPITLRTVTATFLGLVMLRLTGDTLLQERWDDVPDLLTDLLLDGLLPRTVSQRENL